MPSLQVPHAKSQTHWWKPSSRALWSNPKAVTHWSTRAMAQASGLNQTAVSRIWRAFALQPHRSESFRLSRDPLFIDKVRDIVGLYMNPGPFSGALCG
jgi:hypothetical protein